eukprot:1376323-Amorphochlora_amoeboformis.AAC.1
MTTRRDVHRLELYRYERGSGRRMVGQKRDSGNVGSQGRDRAGTGTVFSVDMDESGIPILTPAKDDQDP